MKTAIACLARGHNNISGYNIFKARNLAIEKKMYKPNPDIYDVIIFHEGNITHEHREYIQSFTPNMPIKFIDVSTEFSPAIVKTTSKYAKHHPDAAGFPVGYRHMIRFWVFPFLKYVKEYEYTIRIDDDCCVMNFPISVINDMRQGNVKFSTGRIDKHFHDAPCCIIGLQKFADDFVKPYGINTPVSITVSPYSNLMVVNNKFFMNSYIYNKWVKAIEEDGGIYVGRWGDNLIYGIFFNFMDTTEYKEDKRICYYHGSHSLVIN